MLKPKLYPENKFYQLDTKERVRLYKIILYSQIASTVLIVIGFIIFLLIIAGVIRL